MILVTIFIMFILYTRLETNTSTKKFDIERISCFLCAMGMVIVTLAKHSGEIKL